MNNKISVIVASDNHYAILIAALLKSIDVNHKTGEHIDFYIIDDNISRSVKQRLNSIADPSRITLKWIDKRKAYPTDVNLPLDNSGFPPTVYLRVFSPYVVDEQLDKLLYLDVDTIVQDDISKLWHTPLGDYTVAAAQDVGKTVSCEWGGIPNYKELGLDADTMYFNSGVLLINPKKWRAEGISAKVIQALSDHKKHVRLADQYGLNVVLANRWMQLDPRWNWFAFAKHEHPFIVHFLDIKPIFKSYNSQPEYKDEFYRYLSMTPWKDFKPISGNMRNVRKAVNKLKKAFRKAFS